jgi:outer membrane murein-binding lipoprotein Lpp
MTQKVCIVTPAAQTNGEDLPIAMDSSGNIGVNINTGAGTLAANIVTLSGDVAALDADVQTLFGDVNALDTDVKALTAAITPAGTLHTGTHTAPISGGTASAIGSQACKSVVIQVPAAGYSIMWGSAAGTCYMTLTASATADVYSPVIPVTNVSQVFVISTDATHTQSVNWFAIG